jgi:hypothetical protein
MKNNLLILFLLAFSFCANGNGFLKTDYTNLNVIKPDTTRFTLKNSKDLNPFDQMISNRKRQKNCFRKGVSVISAGYGFINFPVRGLSRFKDNDNYKVSARGPISLGFEYGTASLSNSGFGSGGVLGLSGIVRYTRSRASWTYPDIYKDNMGNIVEEEREEGFEMSLYKVMTNMSYHTFTTKKLDPYVSGGVGLNIIQYNPLEVGGVTKDNSVVTTYELLFGARYFLTDYVGVYAEVGLSRALINVGLSAKFKK